MSRIERVTALPYQTLHSQQQQQRWLWEKEVAPYYAGYRDLPEDDPQVAADMIEGQEDAEDS